MFLTDIIMGLIQAAPGSTVDDILPDCRGHSREKVLASMHHMANLGKLRCERQGGRGIGLGGSNPGRYFAIAAPKAVDKPPQHPRPVNSVWQLGGCA